MQTIEIGPPRSVWRALSVASIAVVLVVGIFMVVVGLHSVSVVSEVRDLVTAQEQAAARSDCRAAYQAARQDVIEEAQSLGRQSLVDVAGYLLGNPVADTAVLMKDRAALDTADARVRTLPTLAIMVEKGYTLDGVTYPPCPKVR